MKILLDIRSRFHANVVPWN